MNVLAELDEMANLASYTSLGFGFELLGIINSNTTNNYTNSLMVHKMILLIHLIC